MRERHRLRTWIIPKTLRSGGVVRGAWQIMAHVLKDYGWLRSMREARCVDAAGDAIPWLTYPAIDFLSQLDYSGRAVFEYGAGASTLFWARRAARVVSVESEPAWFDTVRTQAPVNCELILSSRLPDEYAGQISGRGAFDVIVVDGTGESRPACCREALAHLAPGGIIVLDNSDLWPRSAAIVRTAGLIQVDFTGFAPLGAHAHTTSIFFSREYNLQPAGPEQPRKSVAQPADPWPGF